MLLEDLREPPKTIEIAWVLVWICTDEHLGAGKAEGQALVDRWVKMTHLGEVTPAEALQEVRTLALERKCFLNGHARQRCVERNIMHGDVFHAMRNASDISKSDPEVGSDWTVTGPDVDGDDLTAGVLIKNTLLVITVF